jgi:hypothetical protein
VDMDPYGTIERHKEPQTPDWMGRRGKGIDPAVGSCGVGIRSVPNRDERRQVNVRNPSASRSNLTNGKNPDREPDKDLVLFGCIL